MALYRIGTAAMDAQGVITGTGTKWREPLSLIRTGATIVFLEQPVIQLAVISEIVSDTEMKAISTDGAVVPDGKYVILLNDSLTVDGMAQDVAETLRYYQSKETVIEEAIEFFKNFDLKKLQDLVNQIKGDAQQVALDRAATEVLKNETNQLKNQTQQIKDSAVTEIGAIRNEALDARDGAEDAQLAAEQSSVAAGNAKQGAETARDEARQWAQQVKPEELMHRRQNLADLADKAAARVILGLGNFYQGSNSTSMKVGSYNLVMRDDGVWGSTKDGVPGWNPLGIEQGGTGRNDGICSFKQLIADGTYSQDALKLTATQVGTNVFSCYLDKTSTIRWRTGFEGASGSFMFHYYGADGEYGGTPFIITNGGNVTANGTLEVRRGAVIVSGLGWPGVYFFPLTSTGETPPSNVPSILMLEATYNTAGVGFSFIRRMADGNQTGQIVVNLPNSAGTLALQGTSGREYKKDIKLADSNEALSRVLDLELVNFVYKDDEKKRVRFGIIAEDAEKIAPQYIKHNQFPIEGTEIFDDEGNKIGEDYQDRPSIDVNPMVMDLIGCIHAQQNQINTLRNEIDELKKLVNSMINGSDSTIPELP